MVDMMIKQVEKNKTQPCNSYVHTHSFYVQWN